MRYLAIAAIFCGIFGVPMTATAVNDEGHNVKFCRFLYVSAALTMHARQVRNMPLSEIMRLVEEAGAKAEEDGVETPSRILQEIAMGAFDYDRSSDPEEQKKFIYEYASNVHAACVSPYSN